MKKKISTKAFFLSGILSVVTFLISITILTQTAISGSRNSFIVAGFQLQISSVSLGNSMFAPVGMGKDETVLAVKIKVLSGDSKTVSKCEGEFDVWTTDDNERKNSSRAAMALTNAAGDIQDIEWYFAVAKTSRSFVLHFPNGVTKNLTPILQGGPNKPEDRAGKWSGSTKCGEFAFVVDPSSKSINLIEFTKLKSLRESYSLESQSGGWPISDDGKFDIDTIKFLDNIIFFGRFNKDAGHATGTWKMPSGCSSTWKATKSGSRFSKNLPTPTPRPTQMEVQCPKGLGISRDDTQEVLKGKFSLSPVLKSNKPINPAKKVMLAGHSDGAVVVVELFGPSACLLEAKMLVTLTKNANVAAANQYMSLFLCTIMSNWSGGDAWLSESLGPLFLENASVLDAKIKKPVEYEGMRALLIPTGDRSVNLIIQGPVGAQPN